MELYFPIEINKEVVRYTRFVEWSNYDHQSNLLKCSLFVPDFMFLFKSNPVPPVPAMPFTDLGYFRDRQQGQTVEIIIQASTIQSEVALEDYYMSLAHLSGEEIVQMRLIDNDSDKPDLLLTKRFADGQTWVTRRTGYKVWMEYGAYVVTINLACELRYYAQNADWFLYCLLSLKPTQPPEYALAERLKIVTHRYPIDFATYIPMSWQELHHHKDTADDMKACYTKTYKNQMSGVLTIHATTYQQYPTAEALLWQNLSQYTRYGLDFNTIQLKNVSGFEGMGHVQAETLNFSQRDGQKTYEYNLTFYAIQNNKGWFYVEMFGPSRNQNFDTWAINKRTLRLLSQYIRTTP